MAKLLSLDLLSLDIALAASVKLIKYAKVGTCLVLTYGVSRLYWLGVAGAVLMVLGCAGQPRAVSLPSVTESSTPEASSSTAEEERAVGSAYAAFVAMLDRADSLPVGSRKRELATVMVDPQLSRVLKRIDEMKRQRIATYGQVVVHIKSIQLAASGATVFDCQDSSSAGIVNSITGKKINRGVRKGNTKALLVKGADRQWRVRKSITIGEGC